MGYTNNFVRRIRQHNRELSNGAKYTSSGGPWILGMLISGFQTKIEALQFEWAIKHIRRRCGGKKLRTQNVFIVCRKERWTKKSPTFSERDIQLHLFESCPYVDQKWKDGIVAKCYFYR